MKNTYFGAPITGAQPLWAYFAALSPARLLVLTGGGGKTSLMYLLADHVRKIGRSVVATTTTRLYRPPADGHRLVLADTYAQCAQAVSTSAAVPGITTVALGINAADERKIDGIPPEWLDRLRREYPDSVLLVEGDGSAGKSLKGHLPHEPVIPQTADMVIPVVGMDVIGQTLSADTAHRPHRITELTGYVQGAVIDPALIGRLFAHPCGYLQHCPPTAAVVPFLNQVDPGTDRGRKAEAVAHCLRRDARLPVAGMVAGSVQSACFQYGAI